MKNYYECHITFIGDKNHQRAVEAIGWKFSMIEGDPVLGPGVKCYATTHFPESHSEDQVKALLMIARLDLERKGISVIRAKIEKIIFDEHYARTSPH